jgi:hypothetical protein
MVVPAGSTIGTAFSTGLPGSVVVLAQLASGSGSLNINVSDSAADAVAGLVSPTTILSLSGTTAVWALVSSSDSAFADALDPTPMQNDVIVYTFTENLWVAMAEITAGGMQLQNFVILVLFELRGGEDWYSIRAGGLNAVAGTVGAGAGVGVNNATYVAGYQDGSGILYTSEV